MEEQFWGCNLKYSEKSEYSWINYLVGLVLEAQPLPSIEGHDSVKAKTTFLQKIGL